MLLGTSIQDREAPVNGGQSMVAWAALRSPSSAVTRWASSAVEGTGRERQPRLKTLISISAMLGQLARLGVGCASKRRARWRAVRRAGGVERGERMGAAVILRQANARRVGKRLLGQGAQLLGVVGRRPVLRWGDTTPAPLRSDQHDQAGAAAPRIGVHWRTLAYSRRSGWPCGWAGVPGWGWLTLPELFMQRHRLLIQTHQRRLGGIRGGVGVEDVFHAIDVPRAHRREAPLLMTPGLQRVF